MTSAFSWQNSISLCPASFCTPRPNCLPVSLDFGSSVLSGFLVLPSSCSELGPCLLAPTGAGAEVYLKPIPSHSVS